MTSVEPERESPERESDYRYDFVVDMDSDNTHANVIRLVGEDRRVLELGPAAGYMSEILRRRGCTIVGIELDQDMAAQAARFCERVIVGDLDTLDLEQELGEERFDVIVAADVLEHLRDPLAVLRRLRAFLEPGGAFVVSLPNIAHGSVRLALLDGRFDYKDLGLLDRTHLRFFTHETIAELFDEAELAIVQLHRQEAPLDTTEIAVDLAGVPEQIVRELQEDPDARTYQFVVKAVALYAPGMRELQERLRDEAQDRDDTERERLRTLERMERERDAAAARLQELESAVAQLGRREGEVRIALIEAQDELLRRDEQIVSLDERLQAMDHAVTTANEAAQAAAALLAAREDEARRLRVRLERILQSPPGRLYVYLGTLPVFSLLRRWRTAGYERALRRPVD